MSEKKTLFDPQPIPGKTDVSGEKERTTSMLTSYYALFPVGGRYSKNNHGLALHLLTNRSCCVGGMTLV